MKSLFKGLKEFFKPKRSKIIFLVIIVLLGLIAFPGICGDRHEVFECNMHNLFLYEILLAAIAYPVACLVVLLLNLGRKFSFKEFFKPTVPRVLFFVLLSYLLLPIKGIIHQLNNVGSYLERSEFHLWLLGAFIILLMYFGIYIILCFLAHFHRRAFPRRYWFLFIAVFLAIFILANIPTIGTINYDVRPEGLICEAMLGAPCPQLNCPPDCCYSADLRQIFWLLPLDYRRCYSGDYGPAAFVQSTPTLGLLQSEHGFSWDTLEDQIASPEGSAYFGVIIIYWYVISVILTWLFIALSRGIYKRRKSNKLIGKK